MTIRKFCKTLAVVLTGVLMMAFLGGCGSSDKLSGEWVGSGRYNQTDFDCFYTLKVEKNGNGNGYTVTQTRSYWKTKENISDGSVSYNWNEEKTQPMAGSAKDNSLRFTLPGNTQNSSMITFIEKDGTLQYTTGSNTVTLHKEKDIKGELEKFKSSQKEKLTSDLTKIGRRFTFNE